MIPKREQHRPVAGCRLWDPLDTLIQILMVEERTAVRVFDGSDQFLGTVSLDDVLDLLHDSPEPVASLQVKDAFPALAGVEPHSGIKRIPPPDPEHDPFASIPARVEPHVTHHARETEPRLPPSEQTEDDRPIEAFWALSELPWAPNASEAVGFALTLLDQLIPCEVACASLYDIDYDLLRIVGVRGHCTTSSGVAVSPSVGLLGVAFRKPAQITRVDDPALHPSFDALIDGHGRAASNVLYAPLCRDDRPLGMMQLLNRRGRRTFSRHDVDLVRYVTEQVAEAVHASKMALLR
jgi:hypothetical protein